ncbi:MAG: nitrogen regulation protein NR(II), partial [bacterium]
MTSEHHLIPSLTEGLFLFDNEGRLVLLNPSGERLIGRSEKALLGKTATEIFPRNPNLCSILENTLNEGRSLAHHSISLANFEGNELYLSISVSVLEDHDGAIQGQVLLARDDTVLAELERSFRRADLLTTLGTLNLGIAHEIKNPLGGIKGATQLLRSELGEDSPLAENCDIILREVERIDTLLENLLSATPTEGVPLKEFNIHEVLNEVIDLMGHWEEGPSVTYVKVFDPSLPGMMADRSGLTQVFLNLLKNSLEAAPPDS